MDNILFFGFFMNAKQYNNVLILARECSFSRAARVLGVTQPVLSQSLKTIERELGAQLFDRTTTSVKLTEAGRIYLEEGKRILEIEKRMANRVSDLSSFRAGTVSFGCDPFLAAVILPGVIIRFRVEFPGLSLEIHEDSPEGLSQRVVCGDDAFALTFLYPGRKGMECKKIAEETLVLAVPEIYPPLPGEACGTGEIEYHDLTDKAIVLLPKEHPLRLSFDAVTESYEQSFETTITVDSVVAQLALVRGGVGCAPVPEHAAEIAPAGIRFCRFRRPVAGIPVTIALSATDPLSAPAARLTEMIREAVGNC